LRQLDELEGVRRLRSGVLLLILVPLFLFIVAVVGAVAAFVALRPVTVVTSGHVFTQASSYSGSSLAAVGVAILVAVLALVSLVLIVMAFGRLSGGFSLLSAAGRGGSIGVAGTWLVIIAIIIALLGAALFMFGGFIAMWIAFVLAAVGFILIGVGLFEVGSSYRNGLLEAGGILVAIPLLITSFIGLILSYVALGDIERELQAKASQAGAQQATTTS
jgi:Protein of unknown function (DUF973).